MKLTILGTGYVGLVSGTCFAELGHTVTCVDKDAAKINTLLAGQVPIYEPGLEDLVTKNINAKRLSFSNKLADNIPNAEAIFIAVGTPPHPETGRADLKYVEAVIDELAPHLKDNTVIITKSTVPVGTAAALTSRLKKLAPHKKIEVASNPEFLREGAAIGDFMAPDRIVVGCFSDHAKRVMEELYQPLTSQGIPLLITNPESAETIKYAANAFLATKISFINEMANLCEKTNGHIDDVAKGIGLDSRIGEKFLMAGPGYGGSCFPKDTMALTHIAEDHNVDLAIVKATIQSNDQRKHNLAARIINTLKKDRAFPSTITVLGLTFKANTDDMRDSPAITIIQDLVAEGAEIVAYDPEGTNQAKAIFGDTITYATSMEAAVEASTIIAILTEWPEFKELKSHLHDDQSYTVFDYRNLISELRPQDQHHKIGFKTP